MARLVAFEGIDGSGKTTQIHLLGQYLQSIGQLVSVHSYPVYDSFFGTEIRRILYGSAAADATTLDSKSMSLWYALDRWADYQKHLPDFNSSGWVLLNRYTLSSAVFQAVRSDFPIETSQWVETLEHDILGIPRPDLYIVLDVATDQTRRRIASRMDRQQANAPDLYEEDLELQERAKSLYRSLSATRNNILRIDCQDYTASQLHRQVLEILLESELL